MLSSLNSGARNYRVRLCWKEARMVRDTTGFALSRNLRASDEPQPNYQAAAESPNCRIRRRP